MKLDFSGKTVLVSGASGGLGSAVSSAFSASGAIVVAVGRSWAAGSPPGALGVEADVSTSEGAHHAVAFAVEQTKRLDAVLHLVGGFVYAPFDKTTADTVERMLSVNYLSAFHVFQEALVAMRKRAAPGRLIAIGSRPVLVPAPGVAAYAASKAALHAMVQTLATELKGSRITANLVAPSIIDTAANRKAMPDADPKKWVTPASIAELLLWLASDASADVNGAVIPIYGGS